jgi:8-oxo-dGTP pyrophosphatase MutT (NUDIX family)
VIGAPILNRLVERLAAVLAPPPGDLVPWTVDGRVVGRLDERRARLVAADDAFVLAGGSLAFHPRIADAAARDVALDRVARELSSRGELTRWRDERYEIIAGHGRPPLHLERCAARFFGVATLAAHLNGTTARDAATRMWIARRSPSKPIDPGQLDNLVGGGVAAGVSVRETIVREAWEEAGIGPALAARAVHEGALSIRRLQPDGLQHETIHVHDLDLPASFVPVNQDGEVDGFRELDVAAVALVAGNTQGPDLMTADASLVVADWLWRHGHVDRGMAAAERLRALLARVA